jgi:hypothetical protein
MRRSLSLALILAASTAAAQADQAARFMENCRNNRWNDTERFCETRTFSVAASKSLTVDGRTNGGISVHGWDRADIQVLAMLQGNGDSQSEAQSVVKQINILTNGSEIRAQGPDMRDRGSWSVTYEIWVPRATELALTGNNGGISVESVASKMDLETQNGGISLKDVHGAVHGRTVNGGISAELTGDRWLGEGLDLQTTNGGVHLTIPDNYSAALEAGTVNGSLNLGMPVTVQGRLGREISTTLGRGGAPIRVTTSNGGVTIRRK